MPESSSRSEYRQEAPGELRHEGEILPGGGMAREIVAIADDQVAEHQPFAKLDPDQVPAGAYKKRLGWQFWVPLGWVILIIVLAIAADWLQSKGIIKDPATINRATVGNRQVTAK